ncbi:MAG TPA: response regulator transcription factor [Anaerolineales bacterium]|nr:response regulator transcription factor [Anaerolineales bacterium]
MNTTSSILLVEDHKVFATALLRVLNTNKDLNVVAVAETAENALERLRDLKVDLVLADISLPKMSGLDLVEAVCERYPGLPCAVISGHNSPQFVRSALNAGARGYMVKENPVGILEGIRRVLDGELYISKEVGSI